MLSIAICDDSQIDTENLISCIKEAEKTLNTDFLVSSYIDTDSFTKEIIKHKKKIDIYFIDIFIKNRNGYELAKEIRKHDQMGKLVFFTSSDSFAVQGYSVDALDYIIKPARPQKIADLLRRCMEMTKLESGKYILIKQRNSVFPVQLPAILFVESMGRQLCVHTTSHGMLSYYKKLDELERELDSKCFLRCHQSFLVNMDYVHSVEDNCFKLIGGQEVSIRKIGMQDIKNKFFNYISMGI